MTIDLSITELNFNTVKNYFLQINHLLTKQSSVKIQLQELKNFDSAGLALIANCSIEALKQKKQIAWLNPPDQLKQFAKLHGLDEILK